MLTLWFVPYTELSFDFMILTVFFNYFKDCTLQSQFIVIALKKQTDNFCLLLCSTARKSYTGLERHKK